MSVVVALKFKNGVILGADRQITSDGLAFKDNVDKVWMVGNTGVAFGGVGMLKELQRLDVILEDIIPNKKLNINSCVEMVDNIVFEYRKHSYIGPQDVIELLEGRYIVANGYNIFTINNDLSVMEYNNFVTIGCGEDMARGYINTALEHKDIDNLDSKEAIEIVKESIKVSCKDSCYIDDNIDILVVYKNYNDIRKDKEFDIISKCEFSVADKPRAKKCKDKCDNCKNNLIIVWNNYKKRIHAMAHK